MNKEKTVEKLLRVVPKKYSQLAISIKTLLDVAALSIEEVTGWVKAANVAVST
jgi:hypothetical protein